MEKMINEYLVKYYYINKSSIGNYGIYKIDDTRIIKVPTNGNDLINELKNVFMVNEETILNIINEWVISIDPSINLNFYWSIYVKSDDDVLLGLIK